MNDIISVIVPVYNTEKYIDKCIKSIVNQTYSNLEIILVDDGSTDDCPRICDNWAQNDCRVRVVHKKNGGLSSARNSGLDIATGNYLAFVDSDDWVSLDLFEKVMAFFDEYSPDIVTFNCGRVNEKGECYKSTENIEDGLLSQSKALEELLKGNINNYACNKVYRRKTFENVCFPVGRLWEDMAIMYKLFLNSNTIYCCSEILYFYYTRTDSISKSIGHKALEHIFLARYECHMTVREIYPDIEKYSLPLAALAARRLYDRSLWEETDDATLDLARRFLLDNRSIITKDKKYWLYYNFPKIYKIVRLLKHKIGNFSKRILK